MCRGRSRFFITLEGKVEQAPIVLGLMREVWVVFGVARAHVARPRAAGRVGPRPAPRLVHAAVI